MNGFNVTPDTTGPCLPLNLTIVAVKPVIGVTLSMTVTVRSATLTMIPKFVIGSGFWSAAAVAVCLLVPLHDRVIKFAVGPALLGGEFSDALFPGSSDGLGLALRSSSANVRSETPFRHAGSLSSCSPLAVEEQPGQGRA